MEKIDRVVKGGLATLLAVLLVALGVMSGANLSSTGALQAAGQTIPTSQANQSTVEQTSATTQQIEVLDATGVVEQAGPAVVTIITTMQVTNMRGNRGQTVEASGSGVIISADGYIVTNQHVVDGQETVQVIFADGTTASGTVVGEDAYTDIAVIKVDSKVPAVAEFGDSDTLEPGQPVVAIGTALGDYSNTVTVGVVSGLHREIENGGTSLQDLVQTDAAINHGNSGGPLLDMAGKVIGINTAVVRNDGTMGSVAEGLGFAIPSNTAERVVEQLIESGAISRPYVGVTYQEITPEVAAAYNLPVESGLYVTSVVSGSPAAQAGIQAESVVTKLNGQAITSDGATTLVVMLGQYKAGDTVELSVIAPGGSSETMVSVVLAERPSDY